MKLAFLIDHPSQLNLKKDTSLAIMKRAQDMGWECLFFTQSDLFCQQGLAYSTCYSLEIDSANPSHWAKISSMGVRSLSDFNCILMRKDPPFNLDYIYSTYALELAEKEGVLVANKPQSLRDANEKFFTLNFPQCCPETLVTQDISVLKNFWEEHKNVIFKPLDGMGGMSIFHVNEKGLNLSVILETLTQNQRKMIMAQVYIPEITSAGDKRILLINGKPMPYALARIPIKGELRGNLAAGARGRVVSITERDQWLCEQIGPTLKEKGLYFVGIDVIGDYVTEINVTSPTCLKEITEETGLDIAGELLHCLESTYSST